MRQARTGEAAHRPRAMRRRRLAMGLALAASLVLGACAVQFGSRSDSPDQPPQKTPRDRNRLYWQEQEQLERQYQFDRVGPSDR